MKRIGSLIAFFFFAISTANAAVFTDVSSAHPHFEAINYLQENGIVEGYEDNTFRPNQKVNRAEALKIILLGSNVFVPEIQAQEIFPDVTHDVWYGKFVKKAKNLTIVKGDDSTGFFRPGDTVNLAEALKIVLKTNNAKSVTPRSNPYLDVPKDAWFGPYFEYARVTGLLDQSSGENVHPATPVTRGLLAELMYRMATNTTVIADGKASYYGEKFHGRTTANGEIFDASAFTAAHRSYPFHTWLKVTNAENGKSVVVRVNDRGPYAGEDRIIDLSKAAFESISPLSRGIISVSVEETTDPGTPAKETPNPEADNLNPVKSHCPDISTMKTISAGAFEKITLENSIPDRFVLDEILTLRGTTISSKDEVTAFVIDGNENQTAFSSPVKDGKFTIHVRFPKIGNYKLGLLPGEAGASVVQEIKVLKNTCIEEIENTSLARASEPSINLETGDTVIQWNFLENYDVYKLTFSQGGLHKSYIVHNVNKWRPVYSDFVDFKEGDVKLSLRGAKLNGKKLLEPAQIQWSPAATKSFLASIHHEYDVNEDEVDLITLSDTSVTKEVIKAVFKPKAEIREEGAVILPNGKVETITLTGNNLNPQTNPFDIEVFPASSRAVTASYTAQKTGLHFLEVNNAAGLAVINVPIYIRNQFPLLPNPRDLSSRTAENLGNDLSKLRNQMLTLINNDRADFSLSSVRLDTSLTMLAQDRSDDMVEKNYFGHWDPDGQTANDLRKNFAIQTQVGENLAKDINLELAEYGLMRSAIHRSNILSDHWTRVGIGITREDDGSYIIVQIFSGDPLDLTDIDSLRAQILDRVNEGRSTDLNTLGNLNNLAQVWSQKMVDEDFFDFVDGSGVTLVDTVRNADIVAALGTYIMGNSSFSDALDQAAENDALKDSKWKNVGIGVLQDHLGIIKITLIYIE